MNYTEERFSPGLSDNGIECEHFHRYYAIRKMVSGKVVLDAASGMGYGTYLLSEWASRAYGIDLSNEAIRFSQQNYKGDNLVYIPMSIQNLDFEDDFFDVVVSFETIEHVDEEIQKSFMNEIKRVLKSDGLLIMSTPDKYIHTDLMKNSNEFHVKEFYQHDYRAFLQDYFDFNHFYGQRYGRFSMIEALDYTTVDGKFLYEGDISNKLVTYVISISSDSKEVYNNELSSIFIKSNDRMKTNGLLMRIYWDNDLRFCEENSCELFEYKQALKDYTLCLFQLDNARGNIRIDIGTEGCWLVEIDKNIEILCSEEREHKLSISRSINTIVLYEDEKKYTIISYGEDPQIITDLNFPNEMDISFGVRLKAEQIDYELALKLIEDKLKTEVK